MKKKQFILGSVLTLCVIIFAAQQVLTFSGSAPAHRTSAPGVQENSTCANSSCHSGGSNPQTVDISSISLTSGGVDLADESFEYESGTTYNLTLSLLTGGEQRNGFQIASVFSDGSPAGVFSNPGDRVQIYDEAGGRSLAGHLNADNRTEWTFDWTAPESDEPVEFYTIINNANGNGGDSGDEILERMLIAQATTDTVGDSIPASINFIANNVQELAVFPNPIIGTSVNIPFLGKFVEYEVIALNGAIVQSGILTNQQEGHYSKIDVSNVLDGTYILKAVADNTTFQNIIVK